MTTPNTPQNPPPPAAGVRIPNVAALNNQQQASKRKLAMTAAGVVAVIAAVGVGGWQFARWQQAKAADEKDAKNVRIAAETGQRRVTIETPPPPPRKQDAPPRQEEPPAGYELDDLQPAPQEQPVGVVDNRQRGGTTSTGGNYSQQPKRDPRDAPMMLVRGKGSGASEQAEAETALAGGDLEQQKAQLLRMQRQAQQMLQDAQRRAAAQGQPAPGLMPMAYRAGAGGAPGPAFPGAAAAAAPAGAGSHQPQEDAPVNARMLGDPSLTIPQGTTFSCNLAVKVITSTSGSLKCILEREVRGADGQIVLAEAGSELIGRYQIVEVNPGVVSIPATWTRLRTPRHVVVPIDSPATGPLGEGGIQAHVNNRWPERIGAALLLSFIDDAVKIVIADKQDTGGGNTVVLGGTAQTGSKLAEKVLDATINIKPLLTANEGSRVGVFVQHDLSFANVYKLRPAARGL